MEQGVADYTFHTWMSVVAPAGTPKEVIQRLSDAMRAATSSAAIRSRFRDDGVEAMYMPPDEFNQFLTQEVAQYAKLVTELGLSKQ